MWEFLIKLVDKGGEAGAVAIGIILALGAVLIAWSKYVHGTWMPPRKRRVIDEETGEPEERRIDTRVHETHEMIVELHKIFARRDEDDSVACVVQWRRIGELQRETAESLDRTAKLQEYILTELREMRADRFQPHQHRDPHQFGGVA